MMKKCNIFISKKENYLGAAIKIKDSTILDVNINWIEKFIDIKDKDNVIIDVNPAAGFYLLDEARNKIAKIALVAIIRKLKYE